MSGMHGLQVAVVLEKNKKKDRKTLTLQSWLYFNMKLE